jgi:hypothetical protein
MRKFRETDYTISEDGQVYRFGKSKKFDIDNRGYCRVTISLYNEKVRYRVHRLVAELYIPNPDNKPYVNHKDGNPSNNHYSNLEWVTAQENSLHSTRFLKKNIGCDNRSTKLQPEQVRYIREHCIPGNKTWGFTALSNELGIHRRNIKKVFTYQSWRHIP